MQKKMICGRVQGGASVRREGRGHEQAARGERARRLNCAAELRGRGRQRGDHESRDGLEPADHDHKRVGDTRDRSDKGDDDLIEALHTLEEAEDAEGSEQLKLLERCWQGVSTYHEHNPDSDDEEIEAVPRGAPEALARPSVLVEVTDKLAKEDQVEQGVQRIPSARSHV